MPTPVSCQPTKHASCAKHLQPGAAQALLKRDDQQQQQQQPTHTAGEFAI
jgi:hypothetical protein